MDTSDVIRLILLIVAVIISALFSGTEASFLAVQRGRLAALRQRGVKGATDVERWLDHPERLLPTVLTGNNLVNVAAASLGTSLAASFLSDNWSVLVAIGGVTVLLLVFADNLPKTMAARDAERIAILMVRPLRVAELLFFPVAWLLQRFNHMLLRFLGTPRSSGVTEEEIRSLIDLAKAKGVVEPPEAEMLEKVFHFGDRQVQEVMTPRTEIVWVEKNTSVDAFFGFYNQATHSRFPVFEGDTENVVGTLSVKDLVQNIAKDGFEGHRSATEVLRDAYFVPETKLINDLFSELRQAGQQMAIIVDQFGGVAGLVTLKRLMEVVLGPVGEEGQPAQGGYEVIRENVYEVDGGDGVQQVNEELGLDLPEGNYQTLAGFILERLGRIPQEGDYLVYKDLRFEVKEMKRVKIERVEIQRMDHPV